MGYEHLLSYYHNYSILDEIVSNSGCKKLNLFFDLRNNLQTTFMKHGIDLIIGASKRGNFIDTSVFSSLISFLSFHKLYSSSRHIDLDFYIFFESGKSYFHTNLSKKYKISRRTDSLYGLDKVDRDYFYEILQKNFLLVEKAAGRLPNTYVIRLQNLEADFVPYYLIRNKLVDQEATNVVYSNDHDMLQCVNDNTYIFSKSQSGKKIIKSGGVLKHYLKFKKDYPDEYLPIIMAIIGDPGDDVDGIKNVGPKRVEEFIDDFIGECGGIDLIYDNVFHDRPLLKLETLRIENKHMRTVVDNIDIVARNLKLVSFEILSRYLDNPNSTELLEKRKVIEDSIRNKKIMDYNKLIPALEMARVYITEEYDNLYMRPNSLNYDSMGDY